MNKITRNIAALIAFGIGTTTIGFAQVTQQKIGDNPTIINPNAALEIESTAKGLLMPRLALAATNNVAPLTAHVAGMTVYNTGTSATTVPDANKVTPGYYYNDGTQWVRIATGADAKTEPWRIQNTANEATANTDNIYQQGKVAVGFTSADAVTTKQMEVKGDFKVSKTLGGVQSIFEVASEDIIPGQPSNYMYSGNPNDLYNASGIVNSITENNLSVFEDVNNFTVIRSTANEVELALQNNFKNSGLKFLENSVDLSVSGFNSNAFNIFLNGDNGISFLNRTSTTPQQMYTFPKINGTANQVLTTNGVTPNATLSWTDVSTLLPATTNNLSLTGKNLTSTVNGESSTANLEPLVTAANGLTENGTAIELGGDLNRATTIATTISGTTYPLNITGLPSVTSTTAPVMIVDDGQLKMINPSNLIQEPWNVIGSPAGTQATTNTQNIYQMGNVAIGATTAPSFTVGGSTIQPKLHVEGDISTAGKVWTTNSVYADYVFEKYFNGKSDINPNYEFNSLDYVRNFIKENNHLPGVESINNLNKVENGYTFDMTKLTIQSLEKIEELYIHTIEQQDTIEQQQSEIEALKKQAQDTEERLQRLEKLLLNKKN